MLLLAHELQEQLEMLILDEPQLQVDAHEEVFESLVFESVFE